MGSPIEVIVLDAAQMRWMRKCALGSGRPIAWLAALVAGCNDSFDFAVRLNDGWRN